MIDRKDIIGGSDIGAILGVNPYKSPLRLWAEKTGRLVNEAFNVEAVEIGEELEEYVARKFSKKTGFKLRREPRTLRHKTYDYMVAHIDRRIDGEDAIFEAKTASAFLEKKWQGEDIPVHYVCQCMWYMGITGKSKAYIAVLIGGQKFIWKEITFDQAFFNQMVEAARNFWENHIKADAPPMASALDNSTLDELYPQDSGAVQKLEGLEAEKLEALIEQRSAGNEQIKEITKEIDQIEASIKQMIGEDSEAETPKYRVTWKQITQKRVDSEKLKQDGLAEQYTKETSFRSMRCYDKNKKKKGASNE